MGPKGPLRVMIMDDHEVVRLGLRQLLGSEPDLRVVGERGRIFGAIDDIRSKQPEIVVLDLRFPDGDGLDLCALIKREFPSVKVVVLTSYIEPVLMMRAIAAGADGYVLKESEGIELAKALREVSNGTAFFDPLARRKLRLNPAAESLAQPDSAQLALTGHEKRLLAHVSEGRSNKEIGLALSISEKTVRNQLTELFCKLNVKSRTQAATVYLKMSRPVR